VRIALCVLPFIFQAVDNDKEKRTNLELEGVLTRAPLSVVRPCTTRGTAGWGQMCAPALLHGLDRGLRYTLPARHAHSSALVPCNYAEYSG
jgi:hypothetical protein